jgi:hypothetical protein
MKQLIHMALFTALATHVLSGTAMATGTNRTAWTTTTLAGAFYDIL